jgi:hypothetical protein
MAHLPSTVGVITGTLGKATALRAASFPEWQDGHEAPPARAGPATAPEEQFT